MATYEVTLDEEILQGLLSGNDEGMADLLEEVLNQVLKDQQTEQLQAEPYERNSSRRGQRNGTYSRSMTTRVGTIELEVPRTRNGTFSTELFKRYQRSEQALVLSLMEMVVSGVSTRKVKKITRELCGTDFKKSTVSDLCKQLDPMIENWNQRDLSDRQFPFILVDGIVLRVRENNQVKQKSALLATGVNEDGYREILGIQVGHSESYNSWKAFFKSLRGRGLRGVDIIVSDAHEGLKEAAFEVFQGDTVWQRCQTHFIKNVLDECPAEHKDKLHEQLKEILHASSKSDARERLEDCLEEFEDKASKSMKTLEEGFEDAIAVLSLPGKYRRRLRTTNSVERINEEVRRRERVIRIFPNDASVYRLVGAVLLEKHEEWMTGRRYFDMSEYYQWKAKQKEKNNPEKEIKAA